MAGWVFVCGLFDMAAGGRRKTELSRVSGFEQMGGLDMWQRKRDIL